MKAKRKDPCQKRDETRRASESEADLGQLPASASSFTSVPSSSTEQTSAGPSTSSSRGSQDGIGAGKDGSKDKDPKDPKPGHGKVAKPEDQLWLHRALTVSHILRCLAFNDKNGMVALVNAVSDAHQVLASTTAHQRLIIITGIPLMLDPEFVKQVLRSIFKSNGGIDRDEIYLPYETVESVEVKEVGKKDEATGETIPAAECQEPDNQSVQGTNSETKEGEKAEGGDGVKTAVKSVNKLHGYAVVSVMSKTKVENIKKNLSKSQALFEGAIDQDDVTDMPSITTVGPDLLAQDEHGNTPLENYLKYKFFQDKDQIEISDAATLALTEIYTSCFIVEQRHGSPEFRQESGYICLSKEQILQHTPENLLFSFFNNIRPPKKSATEQVMQVLRRYGMLLSPDKEG